MGLEEEYSDMQAGKKTDESNRLARTPKVPGTTTKSDGTPYTSPTSGVFAEGQPVLKAPSLIPGMDNQPPPKVPQQPPQTTPDGNVGNQGTPITPNSYSVNSYGQKVPAGTPGANEVTITKGLEPDAGELAPIHTTGIQIKGSDDSQWRGNTDMYSSDELKQKYAENEAYVHQKYGSQGGTEENTNHDIAEASRARDYYARKGNQAGIDKENDRIEALVSGLSKEKADQVVSDNAMQRMAQKNGLIITAMPGGGYMATPDYSNIQSGGGLAGSVGSMQEMIRRHGIAKMFNASEGKRQETDYRNSQLELQSKRQQQQQEQSAHMYGLKKQTESDKNENSKTAIKNKGAYYDQKGREHDIDADERAHRLRVEMKKDIETDVAKDMLSWDKRNKHTLKPEEYESKRQQAEDDSRTKHYKFYNAEEIENTGQPASTAGQTSTPAGAPPANTSVRTPELNEKGTAKDGSPAHWDGKGWVKD